MDIERLYSDYTVEFVTEGHKHARPGWVNTECPFCTGNPGYHLGYNVEDGHFYCWRCGWHPVASTLVRLLQMSEVEVKKVLREYGGRVPRVKKPEGVITKIVEHRLPSGTLPLLASHYKYLTQRGFDPERLEREWMLIGTGPASRLDHIDYKHRIIIPFIWNGQQVSFDSRDITGKHLNKYMACPKDRELIPHKEILYGKQEKWKETGILVEGPTDVWRMGTSSCAVSGIKYTPKQVRIIATTFTRVAVCFDDDPQAKLQAAKIVAELKFRGVDAFRVDIEGDPGSMKQSDADYLVKQLIH